MKFGQVKVRRMAPSELIVSRLESLLATRKTVLREQTSSAGLNYTICTALSIGCNFAYIGIPWSQAVDLTLPEARDLAADTFMLDDDVNEVVISLATVTGTIKGQRRVYYVVTPRWLWDRTGAHSGLHTYVESLHRKGVVHGKKRAKSEA